MPAPLQHLLYSSKEDYCNSLFLNINSQQLNRLQLIHQLFMLSQYYNISNPHLKSLHWFNFKQLTRYKNLSLSHLDFSKT